MACPVFDGAGGALRELAGTEVAVAGGQAGLGTAVGLKELVCECSCGSEETAVEVGEVPRTS